MSEIPDRLIDWDERFTGRIEQQVMTFRHRLAELPIFSTQGLADLLDRHPAAALSANTMGADPACPNEWREGEAGEFSGAELLEMVERGRLWLNLRRVGDHHPRLAEVVDHLYDELQMLNPGFRAFNRSANLLISSPTAIVYYHTDMPLNILWHIHGRKRAWVYPRDERFLDRRTLESIAAGQHSEEIYYEPAFDDAADVFDLEPGQTITWPQHTPHRVSNTEGLNVSLSTEHYTRAAVRRNNVHLANHYFRRFVPFGFERSDVRGPCAAAKEFAIRVARRLPWFDQDAMSGHRLPPSFRIDPNAADCVRLFDGEDADRAPRADLERVAPSLG